MRPLDPRLLKYASSSRATLALGGVLALAQSACIVAFAWIVTHLIVRAIAGDSVAELSGWFAVAALVIALRGAVLWLSDVTAARGGAQAVGDVRDAVLAALGRLGPAWLGSRSTAEVTLVAGRGLDALDGYFTRYLPQLILTAIATPVLVLVILSQDLTSGIIVIITLPLIPVFMVLVGWATQAAQQRQWNTLGQLSRGFLDAVNGLSTLKLFGRQYRQAARIRIVSEEYRVRTMRVLRISFLSGFVLELGASLSVALVAVEIGLRLLGGSLGLEVGLFVLLLAPEVFLPIRNVGSSFHAATEGIAAAESAFAILDEDRERARIAADSPSPTVDPTLAGAQLRFDGVSITYDGVEVVHDFSAVFEPGRLSVLSGPSGAGKSSLVAAALGFVAFDGSVRLGTRGSSASDRTAPDRSARDLIAWAGQRPGLMAGTIADNVGLGVNDADPRLIETALAMASADELSPQTQLGVGGAGLSGGQAQRVSVARAIHRLLALDGDVLILDEPTSALDDLTEARLVTGLRRLSDSGTTVIVVSHRPAVIAAADTVIDVAVPAHA